MSNLFVTTKMKIAMSVLLLSCAMNLHAASDSDGDGMSDDWEVFYSFDPLDSADASGDADLDGASNLAEFIAGTQPKYITVNPSIETQAVISSGDAADDPAIWIHPTDKTLSRVIGTDKRSGVYVYDLAGDVVQYRADGRINNIDLRYGFPFNGENIDIAIGSNRTNDTLIVYKIDPSSGTLSNITLDNGIDTVMSDVYGFCMYKSDVSEKMYAFINSLNGKVEQWEVFDDGANKVTGQLVRSFTVGMIVEGCVADDVHAVFYIGEEDVGIWRYGAEPDAGAVRTMVDAVGATGHLIADVEGLAIYHDGDAAGYLIASSQGSNDYVIYDRMGTNKYIGRFNILAGNGVDGVTDTDGIEVINVPLNAIFPTGIFIVQDVSNPGSRQNFKYVSWSAIANSFEMPLVQNVVWEPRKIGLPVLSVVGDQRALIDSQMVVDISANGAAGVSPILKADLSSLPPGDASFVDNGGGSGLLQWTPFSSDIGSYAITISAEDAVDSSLTDSEIVVITVTNTIITSSQVSAASDDAEEDSSGVVSLNSTDLEFIQDRTKTQIVGMRFPDLQVPQGAAITNAFLEFHVDEESGGGIDLVIAAEVAANALTFTAENENVSNRDKSVARVSWDSEVDWVSVGALQNSPDISALVQEVINQSEWLQGNAIAIIVSGSPGDKRVADSFDGAPSGAPTLIVEYRLGADIPVVDTPVISPVGGAYVDGITVSISSATAGAALHYTLDGTIPDESDSLYSVPFDLTGSALLTVKGFLSGYTASATSSENFTITDSSINTAPVLAAIGDRQVSENQLMVVNVNASDVDGTVPVLIADLTALPAGDASFIDYGDGSGQLSWTPDTGDAGDYTVTISAIDAIDIGLVDSEMITVSVIADPDVLPIVEAPVILPMGGVFTDSVTVNMSSATSAALLYYTLDGAIPSENDILYSVPFDLTSSALLTVKGYLGGYTPSVTSSEDFTIIDPSINIAPVLDAIGDRQVNESQLMVMNVSASDTDGTIPSLMADLTALPVGDASFIDYGDGSGQLSWTPVEGDAGNYAVIISAIDALDNSLTDSEVTGIVVTVPSPSVGELVATQRQIMNSRDDAEESGDGSINFSSSDLEFVQDDMDTQVVGLRFRDLQVPHGVIITKAYLEFLVDEINTGSIDLMIAAQATPNASSFSSDVNDISSRVKTMANVSWDNEDDWSVIGERQQSPDISSLIQEVINQSGWINGNAVAIIISGSSSGKREADSFDGNPSGAPKLIIEYRLAPFSGQGFIATKGQVSDGASDAEENDSGIVRLNSTDLELVQDGLDNQVIGIRFGNMQVPQNAVITNAYLRFQADEISTGAIDLMITAQATANADVFASDNGNISGRAMTDASVNWVNEANWNGIGDFHQSPDITAVIQEVVSQQAWVNGNAMALFVTGSSYAKRVAESFEGNADGAPVLIVEYRLVPLESNALITRQSQIVSGSDDAEENANGTVRLNSTDLELVQDDVDNQVVGMRFNYLKIPQGAVITAAYLEFQVDEASSGVLDLTISAQASANAPTFTSGSGDISNRTMTGTSVVWNNEADWVSLGSTQKSPDIRLIIQEVVNLGEWRSGNAIAIIINGSSAGTRVAESFEGSVTGAPRLIIEHRH